MALYSGDNMNTTTKIILIVVLLLGAGVLAYFLLRPKKETSASSSNIPSNTTQTDSTEQLLNSLGLGSWGIAYHDLKAMGVIK